MHNCNKACTLLSTRGNHWHRLWCLSAPSVQPLSVHCPLWYLQALWHSSSQILPVLAWWMSHLMPRCSIPSISFLNSSLENWSAICSHVYLNQINGQSFFPNTSARNLCVNCNYMYLRCVKYHILAVRKDADRPRREPVHPPIEGDGFIGLTIYVGKECCANWTSLVYRCLQIEECRHRFTRTRQWR